MENDSHKTDPWYFAPYSLISCILSIFSGLASLNYFNVMFVSSVEKLRQMNSTTELNIFILIYFLVPVAEILAVFTARKAKKVGEYWNLVAIVAVATAIFVTLFTYIIGGGYIFRLL